MGNVCSSQSSTSTQTGPTNKQNNIKVDIEEKGEPVQKPTWNDVFNNVIRTDLWEGTSRATRPEWKQYMKKVEALVGSPKQENDNEKVKEIMRGQVQGHEVTDSNNRIMLYVCSTGTDTEMERTVLMKDVYPFMHEVCRKLELEFEVVDLRWGVKDNIDDVKMRETYLHELQRFTEMGIWSVFLCFLSEDYGERILPNEIEEETLDTIMAYLINNEFDTSLIKRFYILDKNPIRRKYILKPLPEDPTVEAMSSVDKMTLLKLLKETIPECFPCGPEMISKYVASLYEYQVRSGIKSDGQKIIVRKVVENNVQDYFISNGDGTNQEQTITKDKYDKEQLEQMNTEITKMLSENTDSIITLTYDDMNETSTCDTTVQMSDLVCDRLLKHIIRCYQTQRPSSRDVVLQDVLVHNKHSLDISREFYGHEEEIETVRGYLEDDSLNLPLVVHGIEGVGKSAFMATTSRKVNLPHYVQVVRHLGLTTQSTYVKELLASICSQLICVYDKPVLNISTTYKDLLQCLRDCLGFATKKDPIVLFLDALNNLSDENFAYNLRWLQLDNALPDHVKIVLSSPPGRSLSVLQRVLPKKQFLEIVPVLPMEVPGLLKKKLSAIGQQITYEQTQKLVDLYKKSPSSLFLSLAANLATRWRSFDPIDSTENISDLSEMIDAYFKCIEHRLGHKLVHHVLAYITASEHGLSDIELEDILSCDDEVLDAGFSKVKPPIRRFPVASWLTIKYILRHFLVEKACRGTMLITWCHPQIAGIARERYLVNAFGDNKDPFERQARTAIADYFDNKWSNGKVYSNLGVGAIGEKFAQLEPRYLVNQQVITYGERSIGRNLNTRKLSELPYQLLLLNDWKRLISTIRLNFIEAKFESGLGFECFRNLSEAATLSGSKDLRQFSRVIASNMTTLWKEPFSIYQIASQHPHTSPIYKILKACDARDIPMRFIRNVSVLKEDNTCEMTLLGHSAGVRYCDLSPSGDMIVSAADDGSMNIWYVITGMELAAMTSLPLQIDADENEALPSNPCCFTPSGDRIVVGTEDGNVLMLDSSGTMIKQENTDIENITSVKFSHDGKTLVTSFRQGHLYFWNAETLDHQSTIQLEDVITGLDISPTGNILAVACARGLVLIDMEKREILSSSANTFEMCEGGQEVDNCLAMCCAYHPSGNEVLVGSTDSTISQWNVDDGKMKNKFKCHFGWVTSIKLSKSGDTMFSASTDRSIKMWLYQTKWSCISTLVGHSDSVTMVTLDPVNEAYLVSSSLDGSLKVWNIETLKPKPDEVQEKDDGFEEGSDVTDQDFDSINDASEHESFNTLSISPSSGTIVYSKGSDQFCRIRKPGSSSVSTTKLPSKVKQTSFTADGTKIVILDIGNIHCKNQSMIKTSVYICDTETGSTDHVIEPKEFADDETPTAFCCGAWFIAIGTNRGDVHIYDDKVFEKLQQISWHDKITVMATCTVKNHVIAVSKTQAIIWKVSLDQYETIAYLPETEFLYTQCAFSPIGNCLVTGLENGELHSWKISDTEITLSASRTEHSSQIKDIAFSRSGDVMVSCGDRSLRVWDMTNDVTLKCVYYSSVERVVCVEEDVALAGDFSGKLITLTW